MLLHYLIEDVPRQNAGVGPVHDVRLRRLQGQYAERYNKRVLKHLLKLEYQRWDPAVAVRDAEKDIETGSLKIYWHGGIVPAVVGIPGEHYDLIEGLPRVDAGVGCVVEDTHLRDLQGKYAERYNKRILKHLLAAEKQGGLETR